jgi:hypothetical protein
MIKVKIPKSRIPNLTETMSKNNDGQIFYLIGGVNLYISHFKNGTVLC